MTQRVAWCLFSTTRGTGSTLAWPPSRPGGRAGRCGRLDTWAWALALGHLVLDFYYTLECLGTWAFGLGFSFISRLFGHGYLHLHLGFYHILGCIGLWERDERSSQPCSLSYSWMYRPLREDWKVQSTLLSGYRGLNFLSLIVFSWVHVFGYKVSQPYSFGSILWTLGVLSCLWGHLHFFRGVKACYEEWVQEKLKSNKTVGFGQRVS